MRAGRGKRRQNALCGVPQAVPARLDEIDLAAERPVAVHVLRGQHPHRGPEPVAVRHLRADLDAPVADARGVLRREARALHGVDHGARGRIAHRAARAVVRGPVEHEAAVLLDVAVVRARDVECAAGDVVHCAVEHGGGADVV